ncbi:ERV/ALR sulfhydryl oxidase domain-containing protein [Lipomyces orientalis]|uniref:ERV/ALR sulfhydryl oxidase domain-containing protein n=1 Tax=Lipomyces orientalis TaxID=1233043 RepID=A0ACC3TVY4_9ASCO
MTDAIADRVESQPPQVDSATVHPRKKPTDSIHLPKGYVLDKDGKPCRTCNSLLDFRKSKGMSTAAAAAKPVATDCPPDVNELGRSTWTFLHSVAAQYPEQATPAQQDDMKSFMCIFGKFYPCWYCAADFQEWSAKPENTPKVAGREDFGRWLCDAHNEVNRKLGKPEFDCNFWKERWRDGWSDGRCD